MCKLNVIAYRVLANYRTEYYLGVSHCLVFYKNMKKTYSVDNKLIG